MLELRIIKMHQQLEKIDILRGIAILLVFGFHALLTVFGEYRIQIYHGFWYDAQQTNFRELLLNLTPIGQGKVGVHLFLIISGFLIHWGYLKGGSRFEPAKFYSKRFWRIYPPYLVALFAFCFALGTAGTFSLFTHLTLIHNFFTNTFYSINPSFWSLALEMQLYLIYPLFLAVYKRVGLNKAVLLVAAIAVVYMGVEAFAGVDEQLSIFQMWIVWVLGAYLGENFFYKRRVYTGKFIYLFGAYVLYLSLKLTVLSDYVGHILFSVIGICVIDWYLHTEISFSFLSKTGGKVLAMIGLYSYSIYLFHQPLLMPLIRFFSLNFQNISLVALAVLLSFLVVLALSYLSYHLLELPSIKLGTRVYNRVFAKPELKPSSISQQK
jgi:peptidoglycan/LPS O-acetylase OafA/YrhL